MYSPKGPSGFSLPRFLSSALSGYSERVEDRKRDQIEYTDEDPWIKEKFGQELAKKDLKSLMPEQAYRDRDYEWDYQAS